MTIRPIEKKDNEALAYIIRASLEEFDVPKEGTVYTDPTTDELFDLFRHAGSFYFVVEDEGTILGGCGIFPTEGLPSGYAELVKLYVSKECRGKGIAKRLLEKCFTESFKLGYTHLYLESFPQLDKAVNLYNKIGFTSLEKALGNSGHFACTVWMVKELAE